MQMKLVALVVISYFRPSDMCCLEGLHGLAKRFAHAISARVHYRDLEHAYVTEFDCVALLAML